MAMHGRRLFRSPRKPMVLILDDDENIGRYVRNALPENAFRTVWAPTVERAVEVIGQHIPDVALIDISLDDESGFEVLKYLRSKPETARTPVVMLTGSADTLDRLRSLLMGADRYLIKPVKPETLRRVIKETLASHDDIWWSMNLRSEQVSRLRELFFDATTEVPTLAAGLLSGDRGAVQRRRARAMGNARRAAPRIRPWPARDGRSRPGQRCGDRHQPLRRERFLLLCARR